MPRLRRQRVRSARERLGSLGWAALLLASASAGTAQAESTADHRPTLHPLPPLASNVERVLVDRVVVRFTAAETGGLANPRFITERQLSFEARLEALRDKSYRDPAVPYRSRHVLSALERSIAETLLAALPLDPPLRTAELAEEAVLVRKEAAAEFGGEERLIEAANAEGISADEINRVFRRQALATAYLRRRVALNALLVGANERRELVRDFFEGARSRIAITIIHD